MTRPPSSPPPTSPPRRLGGWTVPEATSRTLARVAGLRVPILCTACYGPAFARIAAAIHAAGRQDRLIVVDVRGVGADAVARWLRAPLASRATVAIDGIELLDRETQCALVTAVDGAALRLISGSAGDLAALRAACAPEFFALASTVTVHAPALAELGDAIGPLASERIEALAAELGRAAPSLGAGAVAALARHSWPGDAAELEALLVRTLLATEEGPIEAGDLCWSPEGLARSTGLAAEPTESAAAATLGRPADAADTGDDPGAALPSEAIAIELAHQIKNPLVSIKTFVSELGRAGAPPELADLCAQTELSIERIEAALDELLEFARLGTPCPEEVDVLALLKASLRRSWKDFAAKGLTLTGPNGASLEVIGDHEHLRQALDTLSRHLLESIEPQSALEVAVEPPGELRLRYREAGAATHLRGVGGLDPQSLPLALLLARGALARIGGALEVAYSDRLVEVALRFATR
jgi:signal transduction histidine kinase